MHEKGIDDYSDEDVSVLVVWVPMFPGDSEAGAIEASEILSMHRVYQHWDPGKLSGHAFTGGVYPTYLRDLHNSMADDHPMKNQLERYSSRKPEDAPMWDFAAFYPPGVEWGDTPPKPEQMIKQVGFAGPKGDGEGSSTLWVDAFTEPPVRSDWYDLVEKQMKRLMNKEQE